MPAATRGGAAGYAVGVDLDLEWIARTVGARRAAGHARLQVLWGGYGAIVRVRLEGGDVPSVVVKAVRPGPRRARRGEQVSDARKRRSYAVEAAWYRGLARRCDASCRVPHLFGERSEGDERTLVLEDLDAAGFEGRRRRAHQAELEACLAWLASFHARFAGARADGLWPTGTYWHLATRQEELTAIEDAAQRAAAPLLDARLRGASFQTVVHGDAKLANFCFASRGDAVAAVDFQYVGGGPGVCDVAYLLAECCDDDRAEQRGLDRYLDLLQCALEREGRGADALALVAEWRALYDIARADFDRFLAGWAPDEWRRDPRGPARLDRALRAI